MQEVRGGMSQAELEIRPHHLLATVCTLGGAECSLLRKDRIDYILKRVSTDAALPIKLVSNADEIAYFRDMRPEDYAQMDAPEVFNRKRDLDVLQKLGLVPGAIRRARYLYSLLFDRIKTPQGICAYDTPGWEGCPQVSSGAYERICAEGFSAVVYMRSAEERKRSKEESVAETYNSKQLYIRPHHLMCMSCYYNGGKGNVPRENDNLYEAIMRIQENPDIEITLVEGCCMLCDTCDGYDTKTHRCVHSGGIIREYKKDLDVRQKLGRMPGATMKAKEL